MKNANFTIKTERNKTMNIGYKIKTLRVAKNLTQEELADRAELSKGFISQLERNLTSPSIATLVDILQCLGTNLKDFFNDEEDDQIVFSKEDYFEKKDDELGNVIEWIIPNAQKNEMEPLHIVLNPMCATDEDVPHEGEEFGYVLKGEVVLTLGILVIMMAFVIPKFKENYNRTCSPVVFSPNRFAQRSV